MKQTIYITRNWQTYGIRKFEAEINAWRTAKVSSESDGNRLVIDGQVSTPAPISSAPFEDERIEFIKTSKENFKKTNIELPNERYYEEQGIGSDEMIAENTFSYRNSDQCGAARFSFEEPFWMELYGQSSVGVFALWNEPEYVYQEVISQTAWPGYEKWNNDPCVIVNKTRLYNAEEGQDRESTAEQKTLTPAEFYRVIDPT